MGAMNIYNDILNSNDPKMSLEDITSIKSAVHQTLLPKFISGVFGTVAKEHEDRRGLSAEFDNVTVLSDIHFITEKLVVTLSGDNCMITFCSSQEDLNVPVLASYYGTMADWGQLIEEATNELRRAEEAGRSAFLDCPTLRMRCGD